MGKYLAGFGYKLFEYAHAVFALHVAAKSAAESITVAGHVNFRDEHHVTFAAIGFELACFSLGVTAVGCTGDVGGAAEGGIEFALQPPGLVLGQMPVEYVDLELAEQVNLTLEFVDGDVGAPHVVHEAANAECGPVRNAARPQYGAAAAAGAGQLCQGLAGTVNAGGRGGGDVDGPGGDVQAVGLRFHPGRHAFRPLAWGQEGDA